VINRPGSDWWRPRPDWVNDRNNWGNGVRNNWHHNYWNNGWFNNNWWNGRWNNWNGWHYGYGWGNYGWNYWWTVPTWGALNNWFVWGTPGTAYWQQPIYYDYGPGGNVTFQDNSVYIGGQQIASTADFAASAAALATVPPPASQEEAEAAEWMPLGTFALSTSEKETDPSRVLQLAVDRQGVVSGTLYNTSTDQTQAIQGQVDKETQRVAFRIGDNENIVAETGLYNAARGAVACPLRNRANRNVSARSSRPAARRRHRSSDRRDQSRSPRPVVRSLANERQEPSRERPNSRIATRSGRPTGRRGRPAIGLRRCSSLLGIYCPLPTAGCTLPTSPATAPSTAGSIPASACSRGARFLPYQSPRPFP
jgi:hypothetical protein